LIAPLSRRFDFRARIAGNTSDWFTVDVGSNKMQSHTKKVWAQAGVTTMFKKSIVALSAALIVAATLVSTANAQTAPKGAGSYTASEKLWFQIPEAPDRMN
jgi:hypothetical protein